MDLQKYFANKPQILERRNNKACREMEEDDEEQNKYRVSISYEEKEKNLWDTLIETLKYFVNKFQQFWKEETMSFSKRWKKKNTFSNYKHHRNILQISSNNFENNKRN